MTKFIYIVLLCFLFSYNLSAQIITDRPDQTESSSTIDAGSLQIETGLLIGFESENSISTRQLLAPTTLFRYGITKAFELRLLSQFETFRTNGFSTQGISDLQIGTKIQLLRDPTKNTEIAFLSHLIVPTGSPEITLDNYGVINKLSISHGINDDVGIGYNIGYDNFGEASGNLTYSIALGVSVNDRVGVYIEPFGEFTNFEQHVSSFDAGFTYLANENLQFDFSFGTGVNHNMNYISLGFSWLMNKKTE